MGPEAVRNQIYEVFGDSDAPLDARIREALQIGTAALDLSIGFFTRISDGTQEILHATGDHPLIQPGEQCPLDEAYCRRTIEVEGQVAIDDVSRSTVIPETAVESFGLEAYIGAKIMVDGDVYGTACFADTASRDESFADADRFLVELVARLGGQAIEREDYERALEEREAAVSEHREIYRTVVAANFDSVFRLDTDGRFTYASDSAFDLLGYSPAELEGEPISLAHPDEETTEWARENLERILDGEPAEARDFPLETRSGDIIYTDIRGVPIYDWDVPEEERSVDDIVGAQVLVRDASERRQREGLISVINRVLRHNVRNEMTVIRGLADVLADELEADRAKRAAVISAAASRLIDLTESAQKIEQHRDLSPTLEPTDVVALIDRAVVECETRYPDASITVRDPSEAIAATLPRIEVAFIEIIENAVKYGGDPATVDVDVTVSDQQVTCRIRDAGPGLPPREQAVLSAGNETPLVHGTGLGLWLSYWIVTTLDGDIDVTASETGTTVAIRLPTPAD